MFYCEEDLLANLIVLSPNNARKQFRIKIFEEWQWGCAYCGKSLTDNTATIDHIIPKSKGGHNVKSNMCCCCQYHCKPRHVRIHYGRFDSRVNENSRYLNQCNGSHFHQ